MVWFKDIPASIGTGNARGTVPLSAKSLRLGTLHPSRHLVGDRP